MFFVFVLGAVSDKIDGFWARKTQQVTDVGAFLDPIADKILVDSILVCFCYARNWFVIAVVIILLRDLLVDGMRMVAARQGQTIAASKLGKAKTATQMTAIAFLLLGRATALVTDGVLGVISNIAWGCGTILFMGSLCLVVISG